VFLIIAEQLVDVLEQNTVAVQMALKAVKIRIV